MPRWTPAALWLAGCGLQSPCTEPDLTTFCADDPSMCGPLPDDAADVASGLWTLADCGTSLALVDNRGKGGNRGRYYDPDTRALVGASVYQPYASDGCEQRVWGATCVEDECGECIDLQYGGRFRTVGAP